jgi:hypothetical protein
MARSVQTIYNTSIAQYVANAAAAGIAINPAAWSMYNYQRLMFWTMAFCQNLLEQIMDSNTADIEASIAAGSPQSFQWLQAQMLAFQFNATNPQVLQFNTTTLSPSYPAINTAYQVIAFTSVVPATAGTTQIKVAALVGGAPGDLDTAYPGALAAAQSYANLLGVPGILYTVTSGAADNIFLQMDVYYNGLYASVIQSNVIAAIQAYMQTQTATNPNGIPFNGVVTISDLEAAIKSVAGVNDMIWGAVSARQASTTPPTYDLNLITATYNPDGSIASNTQQQRQWPTISGYIVPETASGYTLTDFRVGSSGPLNLNLIPQ